MPASIRCSRLSIASRCAGALTLLVAACGLLSGCESEPTQPDPTVLRLNDLDQRLARIERVVSNQSLVQLSQHVDQLDQELRELRGQIETLQNSNETLGKQQRDYYSDLDRRIGTLEGSARAGGAAGSPPPINAGGAAGAGPSGAIAVGPSGATAASAASDQS